MKKLFIISNESIYVNNNKYFCDNLDMKSTPEGLESSFEVNIIARKSKENLKTNPKTEVAVKEQVNPKGKEGNKGSIKERIRKKRGAGTKGLLGDIMNQIKEEQSNNKPSKD